MKKTALAVSLLMAAAPGLADTPAIISANNQFGIQRTSTNVNYTETGNGIFGTQTGTLDTENGPVPGFGISFSSMKGPENDYFRVEFDQANGSTNYTGAVCTAAGCGAFGSYKGISTATLTDLSARVGNGYLLQDGLMATPYVELGRHQWDRGVNYGELYTHWYFGIGVLAQYSPESRLVLSANAMLARTFSSNIDVNGGFGFSGFSGALGNSLMPRVGLGADYALAPKVHATFSVDYTRFRYGISAVFPVTGGYAWEPDSRTTYVTIKLGLGFSL